MQFIDFNTLVWCFPKDTIWTSLGAEIIGYSEGANLHIVIDDGMCCSDSWCVHIYEPNDEHKNTWLKTPERDFPVKYPKDEKMKWLEEHLNFDSVSDQLRLKAQVEEIVKTINTTKTE